MLPDNPRHLFDMTEHRSSLSHAVLLSAGINAALALVVLWALAVARGLTPLRVAAPAPAAEVSPAGEEAEPEVTVVVTPAVDAPPEKRFISAPENQPDAAPEKDARFYSDRNLRAETEKAPDPEGVEGFATKDGVDAPLLDLRDTEFQDGAERPEPATSTASSPEEEAAEGPETENALAEKSRDAAETEASAPESVEDPARETAEGRKEEEKTPESAPRPELAFRDSAASTPETIVPEPEPPDKPPPPPSTLERPKPFPPLENRPLRRIPDRLPDTAYRSGQRKAKSLGTISNRGDASSVDAVATAEGKFGKALHSIIEKSWHRRRMSLGGLVNRGMVTVEFEVDRRGRISNVRLANPGEANPVMEDCALTAVIHAKLPPPPPELIEENELNGGKFPVSFSFILY